MSKLEEMIERHEGYRAFPYHCTSGKLTIGIGRNIEERGVSRDEAEYMLRNDIEASTKELTAQFPWFSSLGPVCQAAMIDLHFNMGMAALLKFKSMLGLMEEGFYGAASRQLLVGSGPGGKSRYYSQVGVRAETISKMIHTGEWQ